MNETLQFEGPKLNPVPTPEIAEAPMEAFYDPLTRDYPMEGNALSLHVASLTTLLSEAFKRIEALENDDNHYIVRGQRWNE